MKKFIALSLVAAASIGLSACSKPAEAPVANETDTNATVEETVADLNATAENSADTAGAMIENASNATENSASNAM